MSFYRYFCEAAVTVPEEQFESAMLKLSGNAFEKVEWLLEAYNAPKVKITSERFLDHHPAYLWANSLPNPYLDFCEATGTNPPKEEYDKAVAMFDEKWLIQCVKNPSPLCATDVLNMNQAILWAHMLGKEKK